MNFQTIIIVRLYRHKGWQRALHRKDLLETLQVFDSEMTDRGMRKIKETTPGVLSCHKGYYLAREGWQGKEDTDRAMKYLENKAYPLWAQVRKIEREHPQYYQQGEQMELRL